MCPRGVRREDLRVMLTVSDCSCQSVSSLMRLLLCVALLTQAAILEDARAVISAAVSALSPKALAKARTDRCPLDEEQSAGVRWLTDIAVGPLPPPRLPMERGLRAPTPAPAGEAALRPPEGDETQAEVQPPAPGQEQPVPVGLGSASEGTALLALTDGQPVSAADPAVAPSGEAPTAAAMSPPDEEMVAAEAAVEPQVGTSSYEHQNAERTADAAEASRGADGGDPDVCPPSDQPATEAADPSAEVQAYAERTAEAPGVFVGGLVLGMGATAPAQPAEGEEMQAPPPSPQEAPPAFGDGTEPTVPHVPKLLIKFRPKQPPQPAAAEGSPAEDVAQPPAVAEAMEGVEMEAAADVIPDAPVAAGPAGSAPEPVQGSERSSGAAALILAEQPAQAAGPGPSAAAGLTPVPPDALLLSAMPTPVSQGAAADDGEQGVDAGGEAEEGYPPPRPVRLRVAAHDLLAVAAGTEPSLHREERYLKMPPGTLKLPGLNLRSTKRCGGVLFALYLACADVIR